MFSNNTTFIDRYHHIDDTTKITFATHRVSIRYLRQWPGNVSIITRAWEIVQPIADVVLRYKKHWNNCIWKVIPHSYTKSNVLLWLVLSERMVDDWRNNTGGDRMMGGWRFEKSDSEEIREQELTIQNNRRRFWKG